VRLPAGRANTSAEKRGLTGICGARTGTNTAVNRRVRDSGSSGLLAEFVEKPPVVPRMETHFHIVICVKRLVDVQTMQ
jgi:hypothetical protein